MARLLPIVSSGFSAGFSPYAFEFQLTALARMLYGLLAERLYERLHSLLCIPL